MTFTVKYRAKNGSVAEEVIEAANRSECFAKCKAQGITPVNVREEKRVKSKGERVKGKGERVKGVVLWLVIVGVIGAGVWYWMGGEAKPEEKKRPEKKAPVSIAVKIPSTNNLPVAEKPKTRQEKWKAKGSPKNPWGSPIPKDLEYKPHWEYTPEDYARIDPGYAKRHEAFKKRQAANPWKTTADSQLSVLLFSKPGMPNLLVPFDRHFVKHFEKSLETPIVIDREKDSPELQEQKQHMIDVKIYLKEQLDAGKDIAAILNEEREKMEKLRGLRDNLQKALREMEKSAKSVEEVQDYIDSANKMLEEQGGAGSGKIGLPLILTKMRLEREAAQNEGK